MQQEILALLGVGLGGTVCELLLPQESSHGTRKLFRFLITLCALLLLLTPFLRFLRQGEELFAGGLSFAEGEMADYEKIFEDTVKGQSAKDLQAGLASLLQREYGIEQGDCSITVQLGVDGTLQRVCIFLSGKALVKDPLEIERSLADRLQCEVEVR